jgi:IMP cyclohydrolase
MDTTDLCRYLRERPYPGRGILLGAAMRNGQLNAVIAYFIMGRSENSRNRVFELTEDGIRTRARDESKMTDPSLIIYHPVRMHGTDTVVTNGDQTDTVCDFLRDGKTFAEALRTREFEPDKPNYTPRISGVVHRSGNYELSILKSMDGDAGVCARYFYEYSCARGQVGHFISTYEGFGEPMPSFTGEPVRAAIPYADAESLADALWESLDADNRVSLFVRYIDLRSGFPETVVINQYGERFHAEPKQPIWRNET